MRGVLFSMQNLKIAHDVDLGFLSPSKTFPPRGIIFPADHSSPPLQRNGASFSPGFRCQSNRSPILLNSCFLMWSIGCRAAVSSLAVRSCYDRRRQWQEVMTPETAKCSSNTRVFKQSSSGESFSSETRIKAVGLSSEILFK